jgi:NAD(P)-dependent dehydrogenase (short-subunit alcohol dehydrogenase family)
MNCSETLQGRTALIIGGTGGIGSAIVRILAATGVSLIVHGRSASLSSATLAAELPAIAPISFEFCDFSAITADNNEFQHVCEIAASVDILCICYGPFLQKKVHEMLPSDWERIAFLDYALPGMLVSAALPSMMQKKWGRIVMFGGTRTDTIRGFRTNAAYAGVKTAVCSLVKSVALEYSVYGITYEY